MSDRRVMLYEISSEGRTARSVRIWTTEELEFYENDMRKVEGKKERPAAGRVVRTFDPALKLCAAELRRLFRTIETFCGDEAEKMPPRFGPLAAVLNAVYHYSREAQGTPVIRHLAQLRRIVGEQPVRNSLITDPLLALIDECYTVNRSLDGDPADPSPQLVAPFLQLCECMVDWARARD